MYSRSSDFAATAKLFSSAWKSPDRAASRSFIIRIPRFPWETRVQFIQLDYCLITAVITCWLPQHQVKAFEIFKVLLVANEFADYYGQTITACSAISSDRNFPRRGTRGDITHDNSVKHSFFLFRRGCAERKKKERGNCRKKIGLYKPRKN